MRENFYKFLISFLFFLGSVTGLQAQNDFKSEADLKNKAEKLFEEDEFARAMPMFSQLLSLNPKDHNYNFKFGVCLLLAGNDKEKPLPYLEFSVKNPQIDKEALFYLGKAYHLNYRFSDAIKQYNSFQSSASAKSLKKLDVDRQIAMCENGSKLLKNITDLTVLQKKELTVEEFFRAYDLTNIGGKLLVMTDDFKTPLDKKKKNESIMFLSERTGELFFSSYGKEDKNGKDIYKVQKLPNGEWSAPLNLGNVINTPYDDDFPYLHPDGKTLYFCSKGHTSMGGYDVFKTTFEKESNTWEKPKNVDFAISTPDDDYLYVCDSTNTYAFFASKRASGDGFITIYKLKVDRVPVEIAFVKGKFVSETNKTQGARITVKDADNGDLLGVYSTKDNGDYLINLPAGGKFLFTIDPDEGTPQTEMVILPTQYELKPLRQLITQKPNTIKVENFFDEDDAQGGYAAALEFIKQRASLEVNYNPEVEKKKAENTSNVATKGSENSTVNGKTQASTANKSTSLSNKDLVDIAFKDAEEAKKEAADLKEDADFAYAIADEKSQGSLSKSQEADKILANAETINDPGEKQAQIEKANALKQESKTLGKEAVAAFNLAQNLENRASDKQKEADESQNYASQLDKAVKSNSSQSIAQLNQQKQQLETSNKNEESALNAYKKEAEVKKAEAAKAEKKANELAEDLKSIEEEKVNLQVDAAKTKDKKLKETLEAQVAELNEEKAIKEKQYQEWSQKSISLNKESEALNEDALIADNLINVIKNSSSTAYTPVDKQKLEKQIEKQKSATSGDFESSASTGYASGTSSGRNNSNSSPVSNTTQSSSSNNQKDKDLTELEFAFEAEIKSSEASNTPQDNQRKTQAYNGWSNALKNEAEKRRSQLPFITDPAKKQQEEQYIASLEARAGEKQKLAQQSSSTTAANNKTASSSSESAGVEFTSSDYKDKANNYNSRLQSIEKMDDPVKMNQEKSELLDEWVSSMEKEIDLLREKEAISKSVTEKKQLSEAIAKLEGVKSEKAAESSQAFARVERLVKAQEKENTNNSGTSNNPGAGITSSSKNKTSQTDVTYNDQVNALQNSNASETEKEQQKAELYKKWSDELLSEAASIESSASSRGVQLTDEEIFEIERIKKSAEEKTSFANASNTRVQELKSGSGESVASADSPVVTNTKKELETSSETFGNKLLEIESSTSNPVEKQKKKEKIINDWIKNIDQQIAKVEKQKKSAGSSADTDSYTQAIDVLKAEKENKQSEQSFTKKLAAIESLPESLEKQEKASAINKEWSDDLSTQISSIEEKKNSSSSSNNSFYDQFIERLKAEKGEKEIEHKYKSSLVASESIADPIEKQEKKAEVYAAWANELDEEVMKNETALASASEGNSSYYKQFIARLKAEQSTVQQEADLNKARAIDLRKEKQTEGTLVSDQTVSSETNGTVSSENIGEVIATVENKVRSTNSTYTTKLEALVESNDPVKKEEEKVQLYDAWTAELRMEADRLKEKKTSSTSFENAKQLDEVIAKIEAEILDKEALAGSSTARIARLNKENNSAGSNEKISGLNNQIVYSDPESKKSVEQGRNLITEAEVLINKADSVRKVAYATTDADDRTVLLTQANIYDDQAKQKKFDGYTQLVNANAAEASANRSQLKEIAEVSSSNNSDDVLMADSYYKDSEISYTDASSLKGAMDASNNPAFKESAVQRLYEEQTKAIVKQQMAKELYLNANPGYVITNKYKGSADPSGLMINAGGETNGSASSRTSGTSSETSNAITTNNPGSTGTSSQRSSTGGNTESEFGSEKEIVATDKVPTSSATISSGGENSQNNPEKTTSGNSSSSNSDGTASGNKFSRSLTNELKTIEKETSRLSLNAEKEKATADELKRKSESSRTEATSLRNSALETSDPEQKQQLMNSAVEKDQLAAMYSHQADSVSALSQNSEAAARSKQREAELLMQSEETKSGNSVSSNITRNNSTEPSTANNREAAPNNKKEASTTTSSYVNEANELKQEIFEAFSKVQYSEENPIPINEKLPSGIIFKVQVGAFKNPISPETFKGFSPLTGETTSFGVTRYSAGLFKSFESANKAKGQIRDMGYGDAFVVAFCNGVRIPTNEAVAMINEGRQCTAPSVDVVASTKVDKPETSASLGNNTVKNTSSEVNATPVNNVSVEKVKGLFYTVQIGVFTENVTSDKLLNLNEIYSERTDKGLVRYSSGKYENIEDAVNAKNNIRERGIPDAFVTAYFNGKRITIEESKNLIVTKGREVFATSENSSTEKKSTPAPTKTSPVKTETPAKTEKQSEIKQSNISASVPVSAISNTESLTAPVQQLSNEKVNADTSVIFKVQIGAFKEEVPVEIAALYLKIAKKGINHYQNNEGLTIYTVGSLKDYAMASQLKEEVVAEGLAGAFVVAYKKGEKINLEELIKK